MRSGDEVRVSTPVSTASGMEKPGICFSKAGKASRIGFKTLNDGRKVRFAKKSGEVIDV